MGMGGLSVGAMIDRTAPRLAPLPRERCQLRRLRTKAACFDSRRVPTESNLAGVALQLSSVGCDPLESGHDVVHSSRKHVLGRVTIVDGKANAGEAYARTRSALESQTSRAESLESGRRANEGRRSRLVNAVQTLFSVLRSPSTHPPVCERASAGEQPGPKADATDRRETCSSRRLAKWEPKSAIQLTKS